MQQRTALLKPLRNEEFKTPDVSLPFKALAGWMREKQDGAPEEIRTPDPQIRSLVLYPAELRAHSAKAGKP